MYLITFRHCYLGICIWIMWAVRNYALWKRPRRSSYGAVVFRWMNLELNDPFTSCMRHSEFWHLILHNRMSRGRICGWAWIEGRVRNTCTPAQQLSPATERNSTPAPLPDSPISGDSLPPISIECRLTRFSPGLGSEISFLSRIVSRHSATAQRLTPCYWLEMTVPRVMSARMVRGSGTMSVCTAAGVSKVVTVNTGRGKGVRSMKV